MSDERIGVVGLGNMGAPMARRLRAAGFAVTGFDPDPSRADAAGPDIAVHSADSEGFARACSILITMLPDSSVVRAALLGPDGMAGGLDEGSLVIDMSSGSATETVAIAAELAAKGIAMVDAPVSGGVAGAVNGKLAIMIGADDDRAAERCSPILAALGSAFSVGKLGAGHAIKSLNNGIAASIIAATAEAHEIARRFGIDPQTFFQVINASTGRSFASQTLFPERVLTRSFDLGFAIGLMAKDAALAGQLSEAMGVDAPVLGAAAHNWSQARDRLDPATDFTAYQMFVERTLPA